MAPGVVALNNLFTNTKNRGIIKGQYVKAGDTSLVDYCLFYQNGDDYDAGLNLGKHLFAFDPQYSDTTSYRLLPSSPAIDKGVATCEWKGAKILDISYCFGLRSVHGLLMLLQAVTSRSLSHCPTVPRGA